MTGFHELESMARRPRVDIMAYVFLWVCCYNVLLYILPGLEI
eukprot:UN11997